MGESDPSYEPEFKKRLVLEALRTDENDSSIARDADVHPVTLSRWKNTLLEEAHCIFTSEEDGSELEKYRQQLERLERELEVLRETTVASLSTDQKVDYVDRYRESIGLNRACRLFDLPKSTYYYRTND